MSFSKVYYFKEGKLELSMLDEDSYEKESEEQRNTLEGNDSSESELVVSSEVSKTLHYMGKYLTIKEDDKEKNQYESPITDKDEISDSKDMNVILLTKAEKKENLLPNNAQQTSESNNVEVDDKLKTHMISSEDNQNVEDETKDLNQEGIDSIVEDYFKGCNTTPYQYARKLKEHIDKQIDAIRNYN